MLREKFLAQGILRPGDGDVALSPDTIRQFFATFGVRRYAVLVDHTTDPEDLPGLEGLSLAGYFSFDVRLFGKPCAEGTIQPILRWGPVPDCDGWLVASTLRAAPFALLHALLATGNERQVIRRLYRGQTTDIATYMDFFSGETETVIQVCNYLDRKYRAPQPLDVRYAIKSCEGDVVAAGQCVIPSGGLTVIDSRHMGLGDFAGYLRLSIEAESLQSRVQPFMHWWADYLSEAGVTRNHQSGWDPWAPDVVFARGYMPVDPLPGRPRNGKGDLDVTLSFWNESGSESHPRILLHFNRAGEEVAVERAAAPVPPRQMSYQNISELFRDVSLEGARSAFYLIKTDTPLHRPNYYIHPRGTRQYINTSHQTGSDACHWAVPTDCYQRDYLDILEANDTDPWVIQFPLLPASYRIDTYLGLLSSTIAGINDFTIIVRDRAGRVVFTRDEKIDGASPGFMSLRDYAREHGIAVIDGGGLFGLAPRKGLPEVPRRAISIIGFKHDGHPNLCTAPASGYEDPNLPFYIDRLNPMCHQYEYSPVQVTDRFGPGQVDGEYDTLYIVTNCSLWRKYERTCEYRLEVVDDAGRMRCMSRSIAPQSYDVFRLSEILAEMGAPDARGYFTVWQKSVDTLLIGYHFLYRKRDHAIGVDDTFGGVLMTEPVIFDRTADGVYVPAADTPPRNWIDVKR